MLSDKSGRGQGYVQGKCFFLPLSATDTKWNKVSKLLFPTVAVTVFLPSFFPQQLTPQSEISLPASRFLLNVEDFIPTIKNVAVGSFSLLFFRHLG